MKVSHDPLVLDAPVLFGGDKDLYRKLVKQGADKDALLRVEHAMKHPPKPVSRTLTVPVEKRKPVKSLEDRLWARYRGTAVDAAKKGRLILNGDAIEAPLPVLLAFVTMIEEDGRFHAEARALINWQVAALSYMATGKLEPPAPEDPDEKAASQQAARFFKGVIHLGDAQTGA
jgi:hypothetical protein